MISEKKIQYLSEIKLKRKEWQIIREKRISLKKQLLSAGLTIQEVRKNKVYRQLKKDQRRLTTKLKHLLKKQEI